MSEDDELLNDLLSDDGKAENADVSADGTAGLKADGDVTEAEGEVVQETTSPAEVAEAPVEATAPAKKMDIGGAIGMLPDIFKAMGEIPNESSDRPENKLEPHAHLLLLFMIVIVLGTIIAFVGNFLGI